MDLPLVGVLAILTFALVIFFARRSKAKVEEKMDDPKAKPSALAEDGNPHVARDV
jgi:hypothetical protein